MTNYEERFTIAEGLRKTHPKGTRVRLIKMDDDFRKMEKGLKGTVFSIDDMATIHVSWENGSSLGVLYNEDIIEKIEE